MHLGVFQTGDDAFDDIPVVIGPLLECLHLPTCDHCGVSRVTAELYFGQVWKEFDDDMKALATQYWPDVTGVVCEKCNRERYCGPTCRDEAWHRYVTFLDLFLLLITFANSYVSPDLDPNCWTI